MSNVESIKVRSLLAEAESEMLAWAIGQRSCINEHMAMENYNEDGSPNRGETLVIAAERDAAELLIAIRKVEALRMLAQATS
jgi:hypothetical protein